MSPASLLGALDSLFDSKDISRGINYYRHGNLLRIQRSEGGRRIEALVAGSASEPYQVVFQFEPGKGRFKVWGHCNCPRFEETGACKHAYAALLGAHNQGWLPPELLEAPDQKALRWSGHPPDISLAEDPEELKAQLLESLLLLAEEAAPLLLEEETNGSSAPWSRKNWWPAARASSAGLHGVRYWFAVDLTFSNRDEKTWSVRIWRQRRQGTGKWGRQQRVRSDASGEPMWESGCPPEDVRVLQLIRQFGRPLMEQSYQGTVYSPVSFPYGRAHRWLLPGTLDLDTMAQLMDHPRWVIQAGEQNRWEEVPTFPLKWTGQLVQCQLTCRREKDSDQWLLLPRFITPEGIVWEGEQEMAVLPGGRYLLAEDKMYRIAPGPDRQWLELVSENEPLRVPQDEAAAFFQWAASLLRPEALELLPQELRFPIHSATPRPQLVLQDKYDFGKYEPELRFRYGNLTIRRDDPPVIYDAESGQFYRRDPQQENQWLAQFHEAALRHTREWNLAGGPRFAPKRLLPLIQELTDWEVLLDGKPVHRAGSVSFRVESGIDWFDLQGEVHFGPQSVPLPKLLRELRRGQQVLKLPDGSQALLSEESLGPYARLLSLGQERNGRIRFRSHQALLLESLLNREAEKTFLQTDQGFRQLLDRLRSAGEVREEPEPPGFQGKLRPYQRQGLGWMKYLQRLGLGGCLADDMGLGKTVQVLALFQERKHRLPQQERLPHLVVVPKSLVFNWQEEATRFAPELNVCPFIGPQRKKLLEQLDRFDLVLTTYQTMLRDVELLVKQQFDYVVLDEATAIKNPDAQCSKAARVLPARHRLALTGTPVENHLLELWSLFEFLNPGILGSRQDFQRRFGSAEIDTEELRRLQCGLAPFLLRRTKQQVLRELPPKSEQVLYCDLSPREKRQYQELRNYYRKQLGAKIAKQGMQRCKIHILESLLRLRQAACHPGLLDAKQAAKSSSKFDMLLEHVQELVQEGHKALVFSQFTSLLDLLRKELERRGIAYAYLHGRTRKRKEVVERFQQDPHCPLFLISLKAGGHGLNLTAADYVFLLDPWWNPAVEAQAVDRAHRIGQDKPVLVYRLIARDTVEEKVLQLQQQKRKLAEAIIRADAGLIRSLRPEDLELLLS